MILLPLVSNYIFRTKPVLVPISNKSLCQTPVLPPQARGPRRDETPLMFVVYKPLAVAGSSRNTTLREGGRERQSAPPPGA